MQVWIVILYNFHACVIGSMGWISSAVINAQGGHTWYWFLAIQFSANSENTKKYFCKFQVGYQFVELHELSLTVYSNKLYAIIEKI